MIELCEDVIKYIKEYIPDIWLNQTNKIEFDKYIKDKLINNSFINDRYVRYVIRKDSYYIFNYILEGKIKLFVKRKHYNYNMKTYKNYLEFLLYFIINNESTGCMNILKNKFGNYLIKNKKYINYNG